MSTRPPLYQQLLGSIDTRIRRGDWESGAQLPSERDLSEQFGVSRSTVRQALEHLSRAGLLMKVQGRGTFVASRAPITQPLERVTAFREALAAQGLRPGIRVVSRTQEPCDYVLGRLLAVDPGSPLERLTCLGLGDRTPLVIYHSYFPAAKMQGALDAFCRGVAAGGTPRMPPDLYALRAGLRELTAQQTFESRLAAPDELALLSLDRPAAVFQVTSLVSGPDGDPVEYRRAVYRGDCYKFNIERTLHLSGIAESDAAAPRRRQTDDS